MWRQLRDKCSATQAEVKKWTNLQDSLMTASVQLVSEVQQAREIWMKTDRWATGG